MTIYTSKKQTGDQGEYFVAGQFIKLFSWACRLQSIDVGVDGEYEVVNGDFSATGKISKIQIKTTKKAFKTGFNDFAIEKRHLDYWQRFSVPVIFCYVSLSSNKVLWTCIEIDQVYSTKGKGFKLSLHDADNLLSDKSRVELTRIANRTTDPLYQGIQVAGAMLRRFWNGKKLRFNSQNPSDVSALESFNAQLRYVELVYGESDSSDRDPSIAMTLVDFWNLSARLGRIEGKQNISY